MASAFRDVLVFFGELGVYDVILPFLLVFSVVFAILEKTKVLGEDEWEGKKYTRKNMNSMISFVIAFMVIASSQLVEIITQVSSQMVILLLLSVFFLLLIGSFYKDGEGVSLEKGWRTLFMVIMFVGIVAIFLYAIKTEDGTPWLEWFFNYVVNNFTSSAVASIALIILLIFAMWFIISEPKPKNNKSSEE